MTSEAAAAGDTVIPVSLPVIVAVFVSVAVIDWLPAVSSVAGEEWCRLTEVSVVFAGSDGLGVAAGELHGAGVAGGDVAIRVLRR